MVVVLWYHTCCANDGIRGMAAAAADTVLIGCFRSHRVSRADVGLIGCSHDRATYILIVSS